MFSRKFFVAASVVLASLSSVSLASLSQDRGFFLQVFTPWIAIVDDSFSAKQCALEVANKTGFSVTKVFENIGILVVVSPTSDGSALESVTCVLGYEADGRVSTQAN